MLRFLFVVLAGSSVQLNSKNTTLKAEIGWDLTTYKR